jgi:regulatory protein
LSPRGTHALRQELRAKGVDRAVADEVIAETTDLDSEREACAAVAHKAAHKYLNAPDRATFNRKLGSYLQRRGFRFDTMKPILDELWAERGAVGDDGQD